MYNYMQSSVNVLAERIKQTRMDLFSNQVPGINKTIAGRNNSPAGLPSSAHRNTARRPNSQPETPVPIPHQVQQCFVSTERENKYQQVAQVKLRSQIPGSFESSFCYYLSALKSSFRKSFTFLYTLLIILMQKKTGIWYLCIGVFGHLNF